MLPLFCFWTLGIIDISLTATSIHYGILEEWNPLLLWFLHGGGLATMVLFKVSELTLFLAFVGLCIERTWVHENTARKYIFGGILIYAVVVIPAYTALFFI